MWKMQPAAICSREDGWSASEDCFPKSGMRGEIVWFLTRTRESSKVDMKSSQVTKESGLKELIKDHEMCT